ncbi:MAG: flagellar export protein FliJ [Ramlibacter sp.]|nr:flagellar export protein FliJ [Ramlibacter sp.]
MKHVLPSLIDTARKLRDRDAALLRQSQQVVQQATATMRRLDEFRTDCLQRSAAGTLGRADAQSLGDYQRFVARLDQAIAQQRGEVTRRSDAVRMQQDRLVHTQQRLLAFETLSRRYEKQREARDLRREQSMSDEFAARALARFAQEDLA